MGSGPPIPRRRSSPAARALGVDLAPRFQPSVDEVRATLAGRERALFDLLCLAGHVGKSLPNSNANRRSVIGVRDPRRRLESALSRMRTGTAQVWADTADRLIPRLFGLLTDRSHRKAYQPLRVLLGNASIALAPDCAVPTDPALLAAWKTVVELFPRLHSSAIAHLGPLPWLDRRRLATLVRESAEGRSRGRLASGMRPGPSGRMLAVDPRLMALVGRALGMSAWPGFEARYIYYSKAGDYFWPHPDDPGYTVNVLVCLEHRRPRSRASGSALVVYRPGGSVERFEVAPGAALAFEARGLVHAREPMRRGERMTMLSIAVNGRRKGRLNAAR